jgi:hypothetical protein
MKPISRHDWESATDTANGGGWEEFAKPAKLLVPTLRVGTQASTLRVEAAPAM